ncbi:MAG: hypothetical protein A3F46_05730 [Legionellales bacterium RIFCSPHIGHO2_12_FULL_42_9]|nr:MAG: hypothetical protein A3F46_05730 [Legionellales bacterium RIFCSPHIGHO2_12_FULL_42_9]
MNKFFKDTAHAGKHVVKFTQGVGYAGTTAVCGVTTLLLAIAVCALGMTVVGIPLAGTIYFGAVMAGAGTVKAAERTAHKFYRAFTHCLDPLQRYNQAIAVLLPQSQSGDVVTRIRVNKLLAKIYTEKYKHTSEKTDLDNALLHAHAAVDARMQSDSEFLPGLAALQYSARVSLMDVLQVAEHHDEANLIAHEIIAEMDADAGCGATPLNYKAAKKVLAANCPPTLAYN